MNLFEFTAERERLRGPQPGEIVLKRQGTSETRTARLPEKDGERYFLELCAVWDGTWFVQVHISTERTHESGKIEKVYSRRGATCATFEQAVAKIAELYGAPLKISACTEVYCYPPKQADDWYRTPVVLRGNGIFTLSGQPVACFAGKRMLAASTAWRGVVERTADDYHKAHNQRLEERAGQLWATWLLGRYMIEDGADWEWRVSLEA